jgi:hypothetical protein
MTANGVSPIFLIFMAEIHATVGVNEYLIGWSSIFHKMVQVVNVHEKS